MELGIVLVQFCADERVEIVPVKVSFGAFGEIFLVIGDLPITDPQTSPHPFFFQ